MPAVAKKKKRKMYFGQVTEDAIIKYNKETDPIVRNEIYNESKVPLIYDCQNKIKKDPESKTVLDCLGS